MKLKPFVLLGIGAVVLGLAAVPLTANAGIDRDEALAFVAGAVVGHALAGHSGHTVHWRHQRRPVVKHYHRPHHRPGHYPLPRRIERAHGPHHLKHHHRHYQHPSLRRHGPAVRDKRHHGNPRKGQRSRFRR